VSKRFLAQSIENLTQCARFSQSASTFFSSILFDLFRLHGIFKYLSFLSKLSSREDFLIAIPAVTTFYHNLRHSQGQLITALQQNTTPHSEFLKQVSLPLRGCYSHIIEGGCASSLFTPARSLDLCPNRLRLKSRYRREETGPLTAISPAVLIRAPRVKNRDKRSARRNARSRRETM